jgi:hypothetical protein
MLCKLISVTLDRLAHLHIQRACAKYKLNKSKEHHFLWIECPVFKLCCLLFKVRVHKVYYLSLDIDSISLRSVDE